MADHALATVSNPISALTDFTLIVDLSTMPANWWSAVDTSDGTRGRVYKGDGSTRLAADWIDFDDTAETGLLRVLWSGTLASTGTQELWIEPPVSGNATVAASDTYGSDNAYDSSWEVYLPLHESSGTLVDRTANGYDGTAFNSPTYGVSGHLGPAIEFDDAAAQRVSYADSVDPFGGGGMTLMAWAYPDDATSDQRLAAKWRSGSEQYILWLDIGGSGDGWAAIVNGSGGTVLAGTDDANADLTTWQQVGFAYDPSGDIEVFKNGAVTATATATGNLAASINGEEIGYSGASGDASYYDGRIQHFHAHSVYRSADWRSHEYDQTNDNATFWGTWIWETAGGGTTQELVGTLSGQGGVSAALEVERLLAGTASATGAVDAVLEVSRLLSAAVAGTAVSTADLDVTRALSATTGATGDLSGLLTVTRSLAAQADGVSTLSGAIAVTRALAGTLAATGGTDAALSVESVERLAGTLSGTAGADAALTIRRALSGDLATTGDVAAALQVIRRLSGEIAGQAGASGNLRIEEIALVIEAICGSWQSEAVLSGSFEMVHELGGSFEKVVKFTGTIKG